MAEGRLTVCCSKRGGTGFGPKCLCSGSGPRGFQLHPQETAAASVPIPKGQRTVPRYPGQSSCRRLRSGQARLPGANSPLENPEKHFCLPGRPLAPSRKQRRLRPTGWLPPGQEAPAGGRGGFSDPAHPNPACTPAPSPPAAAEACPTLLAHTSQVEPVPGTPRGKPGHCSSARVSRIPCSQWRATSSSRFRVPDSGSARVAQAGSPWATPL
ncbi:uncharacterized protein LOC119531001 [Choloepus didactylus]|uniref:uncharacterized protein LOC119531001 n=1 Tax=Choloepus didactylus TaxID=27675 RepID=UPI00189CBD04|nr:uncharacterized protein LOC119531001 [Choloepus didactylus]